MALLGVVTGSTTDASFVPTLCFAFAALYDGLVALCLIEAYFIFGRMNRWPFVNIPSSVPFEFHVDESRGVVYEQMTEASLSEVGHFWASSYPFREPCGRHLFKEILNDESEATRVRTQLASHFGDFFGENSRYRSGWLARCLKTKKVRCYFLLECFFLFSCFVLRWSPTGWVPTVRCNIIPSRTYFYISLSMYIRSNDHFGRFGYKVL